MGPVRMRQYLIDTAPQHHVPAQKPPDAAHPSDNQCSRCGSRTERSQEFNARNDRVVRISMHGTTHPQMILDAADRGTSSHGAN